MQTSTEIENQIDTEVAANPLLTGLTDSNASEWKAWKMVFVYASLSLQFLWDQFKNEVLGYLKNERIGRPEWYKQKAFEFQAGDAIINNDGLLAYDVVDASKRIITQAAAVAQGNKVLMKVSTAAGILTTEQKSQFIDYWEAVKPFTQALQVISELPDKVKAVIVINYDGKLLEADVKTATEAAIDNYLLNKIEFNGAFNINRFRDAIEEAIRALSDENDVTIEDVQIRPNAGSFVAVAYKYTPLSGRYLFGKSDDVIPTDQSTITYNRI